MVEVSGRLKVTISGRLKITISGRLVATIGDLRHTLTVLADRKQLGNNFLADRMTGRIQHKTDVSKNPNKKF